MRKLIILLIFTQSCTSYRIKTVEHDNGVTYFFPQKRTFIGWNNIHVRTGNGTIEWAKSVIDIDNQHKINKVKYIKYGRYRKTTRRD